MKTVFYSIGLFCGLAILAGCGKPERVEITETTERSSYRYQDTPGASSKERFGDPFEEAAMAQQHTADDGHDHSDPNHTHDHEEEAQQMGYEVPSGWKEVAPTQFRELNFVAGTDDTVECFTTTLPPGADIAANVNRWRGQFGLEPFSEEKLAALPRVPLLGVEAVLVNLKGSFSNMGAAPKANYGLLAAIIPLTDQTVTVKMVGPLSELDAQVGNFGYFLQSLGGGAPEAGVTAEPVPMQNPDALPVAAASQTSKNGISWTIPEGWNYIDNGSPMRLVTFRMGAGLASECYIVTLGGNGGGRLANMNRWLGQLGQSPLEQSELDLQPKIELFGEEVPMLITQGEFTGMGDEVVEKSAMLYGASVELEEFSVFIKLVGPASVVKQELSRFRAFCTSLKQE